MSRHTLCTTDEIPAGGCRGFKIDNDGSIEATIFVIRQSGGIYVYQNYCPHLGLPLEWMPDQFLDRDGQYIQCATHGALFRIEDGACVAGPCAGESLITIPFEIHEKSIIIDSSFLKKSQ